jgi:hypothetical protein
LGHFFRDLFELQTGISWLWILESWETLTRAKKPRAETKVRAKSEERVCSYNAEAINWISSIAVRERAHNGISSVKAKVLTKARIKVKVTQNSEHSFTGGLHLFSDKSNLFLTLHFYS